MLLVTLLSQEALTTLLLASCALAFPALLSSRKSAKQNLLWSLLYPFRWLRERIEKVRFVLDGPRQIQERYDAYHGGPFIIPTLDARITFVSGRTLIKEIDKAPRDVLSLQAAAKSMLQPQYSMHKFNWSDRRGIDGTPLVRTLRSLLRHNLPAILPKSRLSNIEIFNKVLQENDKKSQMTEMVRKAVIRLNAVALFGEEKADDEEFLATASEYVHQIIFIAEAVRLLPTFLGRWAAKFLESRYDAQRIIFNTLVPIAQQRIDEQEQAKLGIAVPEHKDCMQWVMEQSCNLQPWTAEITTPWTAERIVHELMALWLGAVHGISLSVIFAIQDLCLHPEYVEPLRKEFDSPAYKAFEETGKGLPLLDSFLKESSRICPADTISTRRKALQPFEFSNGMRVEKDQWVCVPLKAISYDPQHWAKPLEFHGFRHVDPAVFEAFLASYSFESPEPQKAKAFTDVRSFDSWQTWGTGRMACPGRFYAVAGIKQIFGMMLSRFDFELENKEASRCFSWRSCSLPRSDMLISLTPRSEK